LTIQKLKKENRRLSFSVESTLKRRSTLSPGQSIGNSKSPHEEKYRKIMDDNAHLIKRLAEAKHNRSKRSKMKRTIKRSGKRSSVDASSPIDSNTLRSRRSIMLGSDCVRRKPSVLSRLGLSDEEIQKMKSDRRNPSSPTQ